MLQEEEYQKVKKLRKKERLQEQFKRVDCNLDQQEYQQPTFWHSKEQRDIYVLKQLCKQIEYYLSDANLKTDKFFRELTQQSSYVQLDVFLKCNKIKKLLVEQYKDSGFRQQIEIIVLAVKKSTLLKINKDESAVKRKVGFQKSDGTTLDSRTIYVERLPKDVDNELLYQIFSNVGQVIEAKIQRFKESHRSKGFGFVTFADEDNVQKAIQKYNNFVPKEFTNKGIITNDLRVITKSEWYSLKQEANSLLKELNQKRNETKPVFIQVMLKLTGVRNDIRPEEIRAALGHAAPIRSVKYVKVENDSILVICNGLEAKNLLKSRVDRVRSYSEQFFNCNIIEQ